MLIVTNFAGFPKEWVSSSGLAGRSEYAEGASEFLRKASEPDSILLVNCEPGLTMALEARLLLWPFARRRLIAVDLVLRRPASLWTHGALPLKRFLFSRVDRHILYFKDLTGYQELFGIRPERATFVPFKPNLRGRLELPAATEGEYALCLGHSLRDYDTFFAAMERLPYAGAIPQPNFAELRAHNARFTRRLDRLPANVRVLEDDGTDPGLARVLSQARLVVLPIRRGNMVASGISTALNAMLMGKCVIGTAGPGMSDIFSEEVLLAPPEDPVRLADQIRMAWENAALRERTAQAGRRYALRLGGEAEFFQRIVDAVVEYTVRQAHEPQSSEIPPFR